MKSYYVMWEINVDADSSADAVRQALEIQRDLSSTASVFNVIDCDTGAAEVIDLDAIESEG